MTSNRRIKRIIRSHMAETGLNYLEARLELTAAGGLPELESQSEGLKPSLPPLGRVLTVASPKGGAGKTTVALALGSHIAREEDLKVLVVDLDIRDGQIGFFTGFWKPTVMKLRRFGIDRTEIEDTTIHDEGLGVDLLLAPRRPDSADELSSNFYEDLIEALRSIYDYIILDTSVSYLDGSVARTAYSSADQIILLSETSSPSVFSAARWIQRVTDSATYGGMGIPKSKVGLVFNKVEPESDVESNSKVLSNAQGISILGSIPNMPKAVASAVNDCALERIFEEDAIREALDRIASKILDGDAFEATGL